MENRESVSKLFTIIAVFLALLCFIYLASRTTYTFYESEVDANFNAEISDISFKINGIDVIHTDPPLDSSVFDDHITWNGTHVREGKVAPGSSGTITMELDPSGTQVALMYDLEFVTDELPSNMHIDYSNVQADQLLVRTDEYVYSGILTLAQINSGTTVTVSLDFEFDYDSDVEVTSFTPEQLQGFFTINFHAIQYRGEDLEPWCPPEDDFC